MPCQDGEWRAPIDARESMAHCPRCQTPVSPHQRICGGCGTALSGGAGHAMGGVRILRVGRSPDSELVVPAHIDGVSRHHARIHLHGGGAFIEDLGSSNGTFLNGWPVQGRMPLSPGDQVRLGSHHHLDLRSVWSTASPHAAPAPLVPQRPVLSGAPPAMVPAPAAPVQVIPAPAAPVGPRVEVVHSLAGPAGRAQPCCPVCNSTHIQMNGAQQQQGSGFGGCLVALVLLILFVMAPALFFIPVLVAAVTVLLKPEIVIIAAVVLGLVVVAALVSSLTRKSHRCTTCGHQFNLVL